jgi:CelD/BcsL family acetyltransferase involved in cellulose biosynthesis
MELANHPNATVDLRGGYDAYCRSMSRNFRRTVKRQAQRVTSAGKPTVGGVRLDSGKDSVDSCIDRLFAVMEGSYKLKGQRMPDCHRNHLAELARHFAARNSLHLSILSIDNKDAAAVMGLVERGTYYDFTLAYSEQFAPLSPGAYLMQEVLSDLSERGVHTVVSHGAHDYKLRWSTAFVPSTRVFLFARKNFALVSRFVRFTMAPLWRKLGAGDP